MRLKFNFGGLLIGIMIIGGCVSGKKSTRSQAETTVKVDTIYVDSSAMQSPKAPYRAAATKKFDLVHTKLDIRFDMDKHWVLGNATLELKPYFYPQDSLVLDAKGFDIHRVGLVKGDETISLNYNYDNKKIHIDLPETYSRNEQLFVEIDYTAKPEQWSSSDQVGGQGMYFIDYNFDDSLDFRKDRPFQIWTQGETEDNSIWFPTIDKPNQRTTQEIYVTVDSTYETLSNGKLVYSKTNEDGSRTDYWKMEKAHAPYLFTLVVGDYAIVEDEWRKMPVNYYVEPEYAPYAQAIFGNTTEMLSFFSDTLNFNYPWSKYSQITVRDFVAGAMENTSASTFMSDLQMNKRELIDKDWDNIIAHELFHHWFGNLVTCESWANLTLNEAFASYSEYIWRDHKYGRDAADYLLYQDARQYFDEARNKKENLIRYHYEDREQMFDRHTYNKGARVLHMLRSYVGDEAFFQALQYYLKKNAYSAVEIHDLRLAFEHVTGEDLNWFFNQWFLASGHPQLKVNHRYDSTGFQVLVEQTQNTDKFPVFNLPVAIDVWYGGERHRYNVIIDEISESFSFNIPRKPDLVLFDGRQDLLARVDHQKSNAELTYQYKHSGELIPRLMAINAFIEDSVKKKNRDVLSAALHDDFWVIRRKAVNSFKNYSGQNTAHVKEKLRDMALQDPNSMVRANTVSVLGTLDTGGLQDLLSQTMQDSSYGVLGTSLEVYMQSNASDKGQIISRYDTIDNFNVVIPVADYYLTNNVPDKREWFREKLYSGGEEVVYYLLNYFGQYLQKQPSVAREDVELFKNFAIFYPQKYIRLSAYRSLGLLTNYPNVEEIRKQIINREQDPELKQIYDQLP